MLKFLTKALVINAMQAQKFGVPAAVLAAVVACGHARHSSKTVVLQDIASSLNEHEASIKEVTKSTRQQIIGLQTLLSKYQVARQNLKIVEAQLQDSTKGFEGAWRDYRSAERSSIEGEKRAQQAIEDYKLAALALVELYSTVFQIQLADMMRDEDGRRLEVLEPDESRCSDLAKAGGDLLRTISDIGDGPLGPSLRKELGTIRVNMFLKLPLFRVFEIADMVWSIFVDC